MSVIVGGVDECGNGCLAGPIVACCVVLHAPTDDLEELKGNWPLEGVNDSKKLSDRRRRKLAESLYALVIDWGGEIGFGESRVWEINKMGHLRAWALAMNRAVTAASDGLMPDLLIVDGSVVPAWDAKITNSVAQPKADSLFFPVAAASILGKVYRDDLMLELAKQFQPQFPSWSANMGYPTQAHIAELKRHGPSVHHREQASATAMGANPRKREGW